MKNLQSLFVLTGILVLSGCGMKYVGHNEMIQKYVGDNIENLISLWGAPQSTTPLPSGNTVYLFLSEKKVQEQTSEIRQSGYGYNDGKSLAVYSTVTKTCKTTVTCNKKSKVLSLSSQGDGCEGTWVKQK